MALDQVGEGLPADAPSGVVRNLGVKDYVLAGLAGLLAAAAILVWGIPGLDPSMWNEAAVAAGGRPPQTIFPGFWRIVSGWTSSACDTRASQAATSPPRRISRRSGPP